ncbi:LamG-like jellyroll fold domain-containing protein [Actinomycetes bacterium KLBMP 9797]
MTSELYQAQSTGTWNGGPNVPGDFTFTPGANSVGLREYVYSLNGGNTVTVPVGTGTATVVSIAPPKDGSNVLSVQARNTAGIASVPTYYYFLVRPSEGSWNWTMDEGVGAIAKSEPENTRPAQFSATGVTWNPAAKVGAAAVTLDGAGQLTTASPVLDTTKVSGFTVAAWGRPTDLTGNRTMVSQSGANRSMFQLGLRTDVDLNGDAQPETAWCFSITRTDSQDAGVDAACTTNYVAADTWVSLVGIYDPAIGTAKLYVNGTPDFGGAYAEAVMTNAAWAAPGPFSIGSARCADRWIGDLDHVYARQDRWNDEDILSFAVY